MIKRYYVMFCTKYNQYIHKIEEEIDDCSHLSLLDYDCVPGQDCMRCKSNTSYNEEEY